MNKQQRSVLDISHNKGFGHIPSALSMVSYLHTIKDIVMGYDVWCIGKPYGHQAYYVAFGGLSTMPDHVGVRTGDLIGDKIVDYADITFGDCMGVALGYALMHPNKVVWVNLSDSAFDVGRVLEAFKYIGVNGITNIHVTVDCNNASVNHQTDRCDIIVNMMTAFGLNVGVYDIGFNVDDVSTVDDKSTVSVFKTIKGDGVRCMMDDPCGMHYTVLDDEAYWGIIDVN